MTALAARAEEAVVESSPCFLSLWLHLRDMVLDMMQLQAAVDKPKLQAARIQRLHYVLKKSHLGRSQLYRGLSITSGAACRKAHAWRRKREGKRRGHAKMGLLSGSFQNAHVVA